MKYSGDNRNGSADIDADSDNDPDSDSDSDSERLRLITLFCRELYTGGEKINTMASLIPTPEHTILHLPAKSADWGSIITQFIMHVTSCEGRLYAAWAGERLSRALEHSEGLVAMTTAGEVLGIELFEVIEQTAEITVPWTRHVDHQLACELMEATVQVVTTEYPPIRYMRAERQVLPGQLDTTGVENAGFQCYQRLRMNLELSTWDGRVSLLPDCYRLVPWNIEYLDLAAQVVYRANLGTLDAKLYAPFFGDSPGQCRKGLLAILAGKYGALHQNATQCAFRNETMVGINLVIDEANRSASIVEISVDPAHQRAGLGRALMTRSLAILQKRYFDQVELAVTMQNTGALHLYQSLGFVETGRFPVCVYPL